MLRGETDHSPNVKIMFIAVFALMPKHLIMSVPFSFNVDSIFTINIMKLTMNSTYIFKHPCPDL